MTHRILVVDDEPSVTDLLAYNLRKALYDVRVAADGREALRLAGEFQPDLILLDLMIPEVDGLDVCRELRKIQRCAHHHDHGARRGDRPRGGPRTRRGRLRHQAVQRARADGADQGRLAPRRKRKQLNHPRFSLARAVCAWMWSAVLSPSSTTPIELTRLEFDLLHRLLLNPGRVLTRERLLEQAWGYDYVGDTRAVDSAVKRLRAKLRAASPEADCIEFGARAGLSHSTADKCKPSAPASRSTLCSCCSSA